MLEFGRMSDGLSSPNDFTLDDFEMPSCEKFFENLGQCLLASECVLSKGKKPTECLKLLLEAKSQSIITRSTLDNGFLNESEKSENNILKIAPMECMNAHQAYSECRAMLMNPKSRFRGPYGS